MKDTHDPAVAELFAACASCHMADGSGRTDGQVPRLAGQSERILIHKLQKMRDGTVDLPVMIPFARALTDSDSKRLAHYISILPAPAETAPYAKPDQRSSNHHYKTYCATCHGNQGEGNDDLLAPKLCDQHASYLDRRMQEIERNLRGDADTGMMMILSTVNQQTRNDISQWLASGHCASGKNAEVTDHES